jgi:hypothetical protein
VIYVPSFIKIGSGVQKLMGGDTQTHTQKRDLKCLLYFFQNKESKLKMENSAKRSNIPGAINQGEREICP